MQYSYIELDVLKDLSDKLEKARIDYMLTGSFAMNYYAEPRMTRDIDIVIELCPYNKQVLLNTFKDDYYISEEALEEAVNYNSMFNIIHRETVTKVDLIIKERDEFSFQSFERKQLLKINDHKIKIISKEDLIIYKIRWSRESESLIQRKDILNLLDTGFDKGYMMLWLKKLKLFDFVKEFINERYFT